MNIESFMPSEEECIDRLRQIRWPSGVKCPNCGSGEVVKKGRTNDGVYQRYRCRLCGRDFNDRTGTIFENSKLGLRHWFFAIFLMQFKVSVMEISKTLGVTYKTAFNMVKKLRKSIYAKRIPEKLKGEVEMDEIYITAGLKGKRNLKRGGRKRGLKARGRGTYSKDKPPIIAMVERGGKIRIAPSKDVKSETVVERFLDDVDPNATVYTDDFSSYNALPSDLHKSVNHSDGEYSDGNGVHINTVEGEFSVFRPWMATYRGISKENTYLYTSHYEFCRNNRELHPVDRVENLIKFLRLAPSLGFFGYSGPYFWQIEPDLGAIGTFGGIICFPAGVSEEVLALQCPILYI